MVKETINKEIVKKLLEIKGECRGVNLKNDAEFVLKVKGEKGLARVEEELKNIGCPIEYKKIRTLSFYPVGWRMISLLVIKKIFKWVDDDIRELGKFATAASLVVRVYMKFFHSIDAMVRAAPKMWDDYFTIGSLEVPEYDVEKKYALIEIKDFDIHPIFCRTTEGYFENIVKMIVKARTVSCKEVACSFRGGKHHRFHITWE